MYKSTPSSDTPMHCSEPILLLLLLSSGASVAAPSNYSCRSAQRYDVAEFPPRCMDCPHVIPNLMDLSLIGAVVRARRAPSKFSPGLPQNSTCGCWRAPTGQTVDVALNASWVVSGLVFESPTRTRWLREIQVNASDDNTTFIDWGTYTARNFTDSALTVFALPIRARYFRVTVLRYVNHRINESGFPIAVSALVSQSEPFRCSCPLLSSGHCCPFANMTVRNDTCMWCMDPAQISTVMVDGCGRCRQGTSEHEGRCVYNRRGNANNRLEVNNLLPNDGFSSSSSIWSAGVNITVEDPRTVVVLFLTQDSAFVHPCTGSGDAGCLLTQNSNTTMVTIFEEALYTPGSKVIQRLGVPNISTQYLQFDRGRYSLNMTLEVLRSWALCSETACTGALGALFLTLFDDGFKARTQILPLVFRFAMSNLLIVPSEPSLATAAARIELHTLSATGQWAVRVLGVTLRGHSIYVQWDTHQQLTVHRNGSEFIAIDPPPPAWTTMRLTDGPLNVTTLTIQQPITVVRHTASTYWLGSDIAVRIRYGLDFRTAPLPGDSEQIVFITANSQRPIRLKRLAVTASTTTTTYTTPKGFLVDPTMVLDLCIVCARPQSMAELVKWVYQAIMLLPEEDQHVVAAFAEASCGQAATASKAYWMVVPNGSESRSATRPMTVVTEFV